MKERINSLLLVTNGSKKSLPALQYGVQLAQLLEAHVSVAGIVEPNDANHPVQYALEQIEDLLVSAQIPYQLLHHHGSAVDVIPDICTKFPHDLVIIGSMGRSPLRRWLLGSTLRRIEDDIQTPILYVPEIKWPVKKILICIGGLMYARTAETLGLLLAEAFGSAVTLLHVIPPVELDYPEAKIAQENWENLADTDTVFGENLRQAAKLAESFGVGAELKLLHGDVLDQILDETKRTPYDLICMGSHHSGHALRQLYTPDISIEVAERANAPILIARYQG